jgi:hypothetical protein
LYHVLVSIQISPERAAFLRNWNTSELETRLAILTDTEDNGGSVDADLMRLIEVELVQRLGLKEAAFWMGQALLLVQQERADWEAEQERAAA